MSRKGSTVEEVYWDGRANTQPAASSRELIESVSSGEDTQQPKKMMVKCSPSGGTGFGRAQEREVFVPDVSFLKRRFFSNSQPQRTVRIEESLPYGSEKAKVSREYVIPPGYETILDQRSRRSPDYCNIHAIRSDLAHILITMEEMMKRIDNLQTQINNLEERIDEVVEYLI